MLHRILNFTGIIPVTVCRYQSVYQPFRFQILLDLNDILIRLHWDVLTNRGERIKTLSNILVHLVITA